MSHASVLNTDAGCLLVAWQGGVKPQYAGSLAVAQWGTCAVLGTPVGPEFCNWAAAVARVPLPANQLSSTVASNLTAAFLGNPALYTALYAHSLQTQCFPVLCADAGEVISS